VPATQKQLRISDSKFENADSKPDIFVAILKTSVAEFEISDSGNKSVEHWRGDHMRFRWNEQLCDINCDFP
jgi:hypothetical protein